jgi:hypothetical protein
MHLKIPLLYLLALGQFIPLGITKLAITEVITGIMIPV